MPLRQLMRCDIQLFYEMVVSNEKVLIVPFNMIGLYRLIVPD